MKERYAEIRQLDAEVLVISSTQPPMAAVFLKDYPLPFPLVSDPSRAAYQAFGLGRTSWRSMLRLGSVGRYLKLMLRGWRPRMPSEGEDVLQLGGDFVIDGTGCLVYVYRSVEPTDRPSVDNLVQAIRSAGDSGRLRLSESDR